MLDKLGHEIPPELLAINARFPATTLEARKALGKPCDLPNTVVMDWYAPNGRKFKNYCCLLCQYATLYLMTPDGRDDGGMKAHQWRGKHIWPWSQPRAEGADELDEEATY